MTGAPSMRIAKFIAAAGICSRRQAEVLIEEGKVKVNGKTIDSPALNVSEADSILVNNKPIFVQSTPRLWLYHKPAGLVTTHKDPQGRPTVFSALPADMPRVISVGRLDLNSEGLLLLSTSGDLARALELPSTGMPRTYRARIFGTPKQRELNMLADGVQISGVKYGPIQVNFEKTSASNIWVEVTLHEGKNREIRKVFEHIGHPVSRLIRTAYGPFALDDLAKGQVKEISEKRIHKALKDYDIML